MCCQILFLFLFQLHYTRLPRDIKDQYIFLMDATVATGAAAMMAIRVLLDHDVPEDRIFLCSLLMAQSGIYRQLLDTTLSVTHCVKYAIPGLIYLKIVLNSLLPGRFLDCRCRLHNRLAQAGYWNSLGPQVVQYL